MKYDIIVIGSGITGMRAAIEAKELGLNIAVVTKNAPIANNSFMAKGGINAALGNMDDDTIEAHIQDTLNGGVGIAQEQAVRVFCEKAPEAVRELDGFGAKFSRLANGNIAQRPFGGTDKKRTCYAADNTGSAIMKALHKVLKELEIDVYKNHFALSLLKKENQISGITAYDEESQKVKVFQAKAVILANGGFSALYKNYTTNVPDATGDGIAMGLRAGLRAMDMEFVQFHPTGLKGTNFLVSEAARAEGGRLINSLGKQFVNELNTRDFVTRAILKEIQKGREVFLDLTGIDQETIDTKLTNLKKRVKSLKKIDISEEYIPINPLAHYTIGGIECDINGVTSIKGLYVAGEASCNGVNGANRLGGNSLSEGAVFGKIAGYQAAKYAYKTPDFNDVLQEEVQKDRDLIESIKKKVDFIDTKEVRNEIGELMFKHIGIIRNGYQLKKVIKLLEEIEESLIDPKVESQKGSVKELLEIINALLVAKTAAQSALLREESRGTHFRLDAPESDYEFMGHTYITSESLL